MLSLLVMILLASSCTKHYAAAVTTDKPVAPVTAVAIPKADTIGLADSLIGTWKIRKTEIEQAVDKMTTFGSQAQRDAQDEKLKQYQAAFLGLTTTFNADKTFQSIFSGQSDIGTWQVTRSRHVETISKVTGTGTSFQVLSLDAGILIVRYETTDMSLLLTFAKQ